MRSIVRLLAGAMLFAAAMSSASAAIWYVSGTGSLSGTGTSIATAFRQPSQAAAVVNPGDTVFLLAGDYDPFTVTRSGAEGAVITWKAAVGATPRVRFSNAAIATLVTQRSTVGTDLAASAALTINASFQVFDGINFEGNNDLIESTYLAAAKADAQNILRTHFTKTAYWTISRGSPAKVVALNASDNAVPNAPAPFEGFNIRGIVLDNRLKYDDATKAHKITIKNCIIQKFPDAGVAILMSDYLTFENNRVYQNGWYGSLAGSPTGLGGGTGMGAAGLIFSAYRYDDNTGYRNVIRRNKFWANDAKLQRKSCFSASTLIKTNNTLETVTVPTPAVCGGVGINLVGFDPTSRIGGTTIAFPFAVPAANAVYKGRTLVANNLITGNGGSGIRSSAAFGGNADTSGKAGVASNGYVYNVDILNNTLYKNENPNNTDGLKLINYNGSLYSLYMATSPGATTQLVANNIFWTVKKTTTDTNYQAAPTAVVGANGGNEVVRGIALGPYLNTAAGNLFWTDEPAFVNCSSTACATYVTHFRKATTEATVDVVRDPSFVSPSNRLPANLLSVPIASPDTAGINYSLNSYSPARNKGRDVKNNAIGRDLNGSARPQGTITEVKNPTTGVISYSRVSADQVYDIGALEYVEPPKVTLRQVADDGVLANDYKYKVQNYNVGDSYSATGLPPGLSINSSTGLISGVPTAAGTYVASVTVGSQVRNSSGVLETKSDTNTVTITITSVPPTYSTSVGYKSYYCTGGYCKKSDSEDPSLQYSATGLPNGLTINPITGEISGIATTTGTYTVSISGPGVAIVTFIVGDSIAQLPGAWSPDSSTIVGAGANPEGIFASPDSSKWVLTGRTTRVGNTSDSFVSSWKQITGDVTITAKVLGFTSDQLKSAVGVMIRQYYANDPSQPSVQTNSPDAVHAATFVSPVKGVTYVRRLTKGDVTRNTRGYKLLDKSPVWVRMQRVGDKVTSSYSLDGTSWNVIRTETVSFTDPVQVGLAVSSGRVVNDDGDLLRPNEGTFSNVSITKP
jgi:Putative Ig domain